MNEDTNLRAFLQPSETIDWEQPAVLDVARRLAAGLDEPRAAAERCFEWVRDEILHTDDHRLEPVTRSASEALAARHGFCYAKAAEAAIAGPNRGETFPPGRRLTGCRRRLRVVRLAAGGLDRVGAPVRPTPSTWPSRTRNAAPDAGPAWAVANGSVADGLTRWRWKFGHPSGTPAAFWERPGPA